MSFSGDFDSGDLFDVSRRFNSSDLPNGPTISAPASVVLAGDALSDCGVQASEHGQSVLIYGLDTCALDLEGVRLLHTFEGKRLLAMHC